MTDKARSYQRIGNVIQLLALASGLVVTLYAISWFMGESYGGVTFRRWLLAGAGVGLLVLAAAARWIKPVPMAVGFLSLTGAVGVAFISALIADKIALAKAAAISDKAKPVNIWRYDERYGYDHIAGTTGVHENAHGDFKVTYTIDSDGSRKMSSPANPAGRILITGGSFTFGHGLNDDDTWPVVLNRKFFPNQKVINRTAMGWGTAHAHLAIEDALSSDQPPTMVIYAMIPHHIERTYIRKSWVTKLNNNPAHVATGDDTDNRRSHPHFELVDGQPIYKGSVLPDACLPDSPDIKRIEQQLTISLIKSMHRRCSDRNIPFYTVLLPNTEKWPNGFGNALVDASVPIINIRHLQLAYFEHDGHPTTDDAQRMATAIGDSLLKRGIQTETLQRPLVNATGQNLEVQQP